MSRWLVGSSSSSTCGTDAASEASTTRAFCPPDRCLSAITCARLSSPYLPSCCRHRWLASSIAFP
eukprot:767089-Hanusia_phi.AAC.3